MGHWMADLLPAWDVNLGFFKFNLVRHLSTRLGFASVLTGFYHAESGPVLVERACG